MGQTQINRKGDDDRLLRPADRSTVGGRPGCAAGTGSVQGLHEPGKKGEKR